jgi:hypothetical protein
MAGSPPVSRNDRVGERVAQAAGLDRIAVQQQFVDRIIGELIGVIAVRMATRAHEQFRVPALVSSKTSVA